jgi:osmotically-inducible protein OsmY
MPNDRDDWRSRRDDRGDRFRDDDDARYLRHREDDLRSVGSPGIGGGTGGYRDRDEDPWRDRDRDEYNRRAMSTSAGWGREVRGPGRDEPWSPPQSGLERTARGWAGGLTEGGEGGHAGKGPAGYQRSDARISEDVHDELTFDDQVDASQLTVKVEQGEVTLSGTVASREMKRRAEQLAERVRGVKDVHNQIRVGGNGGVRRGPASE